MTLEERIGRLEKVVEEILNLQGKLNENVSTMADVIRSVMIEIEKTKAQKQLKENEKQSVNLKP